MQYSQVQLCNHEHLSLWVWASAYFLNSLRFFSAKATKYSNDPRNVHLHGLHIAPSTVIHTAVHISPSSAALSSLPGDESLTRRMDQNGSGWYGEQEIEIRITGISRVVISMITVQSERTEIFHKIAENKKSYFMNNVWLDSCSINVHQILRSLFRSHIKIWIRFYHIKACRLRMDPDIKSKKKKKNSSMNIMNKLIFKTITMEMV